MTSFQIQARDASPKGYGRVETITVRLVVQNCEGEVWFTDILLQPGSIATGWVGNVAEIEWTEGG
ncbi:hypothetical protein ABB02_00243 [Clostridiaceae bacterium JG1575]|nr:hypothetical protein ABB02_00243 [Clostridiaceae bacterium JG1575]